MAEKQKVDDWKALAEKQLRGKPLEALDWDTPEGIKVKPLYTAEDLEGLEHIDTMPGFAPYTKEGPTSRRGRMRLRSPAS